MSKDVEGKDVLHLEVKEGFDFLFVSKDSLKTVSTKYTVDIEDSDYLDILIDIPAQNSMEDE